MHVYSKNYNLQFINCLIQFNSQQDISIKGPKCTLASLFSKLAKEAA